jgi:predicted nucleotide-binding protein (sugar kinase/HSP70/actin superfamily)
MAKLKQDKKKIGIPYVLTHFLLKCDWEKFFEILGNEVVYTKSSTYKKFKTGSKYSVSDQCLPVKTFYGHIIELKDKVDYIFVPQIVSLRKDTYSCPQIIGAPLLAKAIPLDLPPVITFALDLNYPEISFCRAINLAFKLTKNPYRVYKGVRFLRKNIRNILFAEISKDQAYKPVESIAVIGRKYALNDPFISMNVIDKIKKYGLPVVTSEDIENFTIKDADYFNCKPVHWYSGQNLISAADYFVKDHNIKGIIYLNYFGCGIDAFTEEVFKTELSKNKPYLCLSLDEHTGEAGIMTRIEAFIDMIIRKKKIGS